MVIKMKEVIVMVSRPPQVMSFSYIFSEKQTDGKHLFWRLFFVSSVID